MLNVAAALLFLYAAFWIAGAFIAIYPTAGLVGVVGAVASFFAWRKHRFALYAAVVLSVGIGTLWVLDLVRWFNRGVSPGDVSGVLLGATPTLLAIAITVLVRQGLRVRANNELERARDG